MALTKRSRTIVRALLAVVIVLAVCAALLLAPFGISYFALFSDQNKRFTLYGLVVDTDGAPIADAKVHASLSKARVSVGAIGRWDRSEKEVLTDSAGRFEISGTAQSARIFLKKKNFIFDNHLIYGLHQSEFSENPTERLGTKENPRRVVAWEARTLAQRADIRPGKERFTFVSDGQPKTLGFDTNWRIEKMGLALTISINKDPSGTWANPAGWGASISVVNGDLVPAAVPGLLMEAPQDGYQPIWSARYESDDKASRGREPLSFFVRYGDEPRYASVVITLVPYLKQSGESRARIEYRLNKVGSRILATRSDLRPQ